MDKDSEYFSFSPPLQLLLLSKQPSEKLLNKNAIQCNQAKIRISQFQLEWRR